MLVDDPSKRGVYTDAHTSCLIPRWRDAATIISTKSALFDIPEVAVDEDGTVITLISRFIILRMAKLYGMPIDGSAE